MIRKPGAKVILDSISPDGIRLTTLEVVMWRYVLAEANTHRDWSRNSGSSRARPVEKILAEILENPALPYQYTAEKPGMQGGELLSEKDIAECEKLIVQLSRDSYAVAHRLNKILNLHKQHANRYIEPYMWHTAIISSTKWANFLNQRCDEMAQPEFHYVADEIQKAIYLSKPTRIEYGQWHLPYIQPDEYFEVRQLAEHYIYEENKRRTEHGDNELPLTLDEQQFKWLKAISTARCARVSYLQQDGTRSLFKDIEMHDDRLRAHNHPSPFEHVATPCPHLQSIKQCQIVKPYEGIDDNFEDDIEVICRRWGNFYGWDQYRKEWEDENRTTFVPNLPETQGMENVIR